jgi:hypothetical protein
VNFPSFYARSIRNKENRQQYKYKRAIKSMKIASTMSRKDHKNKIPSITNKPAIKTEESPKGKSS